MKREKFCRDWRFWKEGNEDKAVCLDLPHDAMIFEKRDPNLENGNATGFFPGGKYIYTKTIFGDDNLMDQTLLLEFEGVYMNSSVYLNGEKVGGRLYGYSDFFVDLSGKLRKGEENELKVVVDNSRTPNSRWYSGSGIYRPVFLWKGALAHILPDGIKVRTISTNPAVLEISITARMEEGMELLSSIEKDGSVVAQMTGANGIVEIPDAVLWSSETPSLYTIRTKLLQGGKVIDEGVECFGIRTLAWDAERGFQVNGDTVKLRGGCIHHDHGLLGACAYEQAERRRVRKLKEFGYNAIRYSHNPADKNFLNICDELGMYVIDETFDQWLLPQSKYDYAGYFAEEWKKDVCSLVNKDYNHPCVIMYCIGNEITDTGLPIGVEMSKELNEVFHKLDSTRPTMIAINSMLSVLAARQAERKKAEEADGKTPDDKTVGSADVNDIVTLLPKIMASITPESLEELIGKCISYVDIVGYNYGHNLYEGTHLLAPERVILSSETFPKKMDNNWEVVCNNDYLIGDFMWTAWDYLGEAGVGLPVYGTEQAPFSKSYPCLTAGCGSFDLTGYPESQAYYAAALWGFLKEPYIGVRPVYHSGEKYTLGQWRLTDSINCWTWPGAEGKTAEIEIFSPGAYTELFQNGKSLGRKKLKNCRCTFETPYIPGELKAVSYDINGHEIGTGVLKTADNTEKLTMIAEKAMIAANGEDLAYIAVNITDEAGNIKMTTDKKVRVSVEGEGVLLAVGSGNPETEESFFAGEYTSWHGRVLAIVKSTDTAGKIKVMAEAEGIESTMIEIVTR